MSVVVPMEHDSHVAVQGLLPWYARGQLGDEEMREVQAHLLQCPACRAELEAEQPLQALLSLPAVAPAVGDVESGLARMRARLNAEPLKVRARVPRWMGWTLGLQGCAIAVLLAWLILPRLEVEAPAYKGLSAPGPSQQAEALIMFRADASEQRIREVLQAHGASIVGSQTESGAYRLRLPANAQALPALRAEPIVTLVESLQAGARQ